MQLYQAHAKIITPIISHYSVFKINISVTQEILLSQNFLAIKRPVCLKTVETVCLLSIYECIKTMNAYTNHIY